MFDDLPAPFMVDSVKVWPCASRPGYQWFIAHSGKPMYFKSKAAVILFAKDVRSMRDLEGLYD